MTTRAPQAPSARSFEDALLGELLAVHAELQRAGAQPETAALPKRAGLGIKGLRRRHPGLRPLDGSPGDGSAPRPRRRAVLVVAGACAALVAAVLAVANMRGPAQTVTIRPAAGPGLVPGTIVVAQRGSNYAPVGNGGGTAGTARGVIAQGEISTYSPDSGGDLVQGISFTRGMNGPVTLALDPIGDLWVANDNNQTLVEYSKSSLLKADDPAPAVVISAASPGELSNPYGMAFDRSGNLWVANTGVGTVTEYTRAELARSGAPRPHTTIAASRLNNPCGIAFDASGDLWVANNGNGKVEEFTRQQLTGTSPAPSVVISPDGSGQTAGAINLAFDSSGNMWVSEYQANTLVEYTRQQFARSGAPVPAVTISSVYPKSTANGASSIDGAAALQFDSSGNLWISNFFDNTVDEFARSQLAKSGAPDPRRVLAGSKMGMNYPSYLIIEPQTRR
jgi:secreted PhoX family phosphatase